MFRQSIGPRNRSLDAGTLDESPGAAAVSCARTLLLALLLSLAACTDGVPDLNALGDLSLKPQFTDGSSEREIVLTTWGQGPGVITGKCDARMSSLEFRFDEGQWLSSSSAAANAALLSFDADCTDQNFSVEV